MTRPLFIHSDTKILDRINKESNSSALVTHSMAQGLQWISNPETRLSGVYLSPDDSSFSAFRFLEITLNHRPTLPIYLFEPSLATNFEKTQKIMKNTHVKGVYSGVESFQTLVSPLKENISDKELQRELVPESAKKPGYYALPISDFYTGSYFTYDTFILKNDQMTLFGQKNTPLDSAYITNAAQTSKFLYLREEDLNSAKTELSIIKENFLDSDIPFSWKSAEVFSKSREILLEMRKSGMTDQLLDYTQVMLSDLFKLISKIDADEGSVYNLIEQAKQCDRSVFCASYSILVCKQLRFEKTATLEILGLASVLQDISLYKTTSGDLSQRLLKDLNADERIIYAKHPTISADLVSHHTDVPQVTLQVIRQQHERKDRTGFPNRIGGNQLHPMAEILSLINSFYEVTRSISDDAQSINELGKSVFPHYSENIIQAFKSVLGTVLKDKIKTHTNMSPTH